MARPKKLTFRQIELVDTVARLRSVSAAARQLNITQPTLTHAIKTIEDEVGAELFRRVHGGVEPTVFAEPFLVHATSIRADLTATVVDLRRLDLAVPDELRIHAGMRSNVFWVAEAIAVMSERHLDLTIRISDDISAVPRKLMSGELDIAFAEFTLMWWAPTLSSAPLGRYQTPFMCRARHPLTAIERPSVEDLRRYPFVGDVCIKRQFEAFEGDFGKLAQIDPASGQLLPAIRVNELQSIVHILTHSDAVTTVPPELFDAALHDGSLVRLETEGVTGLYWDVHLFFPPGRPDNPLAEDFVSIVRDIEADRQRGARKPSDRKKGVPARVIARPLNAEQQEVAPALAKPSDPNCLRIDAGPRSGLFWVNEAIARLGRTNPDLRIRLIDDVSHLPTRLTDGTLDIALSERSLLDDAPFLASEPLGRYRVVWLCRAGHPLTKLETVTPEDLRDFPYAGDHCVARHFEPFEGQYGKHVSLDPKTGDLLPAIRVGSIDATCHVVLNTDAVTILPPEIIAEHLQVGRMIALAMGQFPDLWCEHYLYYPPDGRKNPLVEPFVSLLREIEDLRKTRADPLLLPDRARVQA